MFSFDVSAIDIVLIVAVIVLLFLFSAYKKSHASTTEKSHTPIIEKLFLFSARKKSHASTTEKSQSPIIEKPYVPIVEKPYAPIIEESQVEEEKPLQEEHEVVSETFKLEDIAPKSSASPPNCVHDFGYLGSRPKNTPIPDECLGCPKVIQCLSQKE